MPSETGTAIAGETFSHSPRFLRLTLVRESEANCSFEVPQDALSEFYMLGPRICQRSARHRDCVRDVPPGFKYNVHQRSDHTLVRGPLIWRARVVSTVLWKR